MKKILILASMVIVCSTTMARSIGNLPDWSNPPSEETRLDNLEKSVYNMRGHYDHELRDLEDKLDGGLAIASAFSAIDIDKNPGQVSVGIGVGTYSGSSGFALAGGTTFNNGLSTKVGVGFSESEVMTNAGLTYTFD